MYFKGFGMYFDAFEGIFGYVNARVLWRAPARACALYGAMQHLHGTSLHGAMQHSKRSTPPLARKLTTAPRCGSDHAGDYSTCSSSNSIYIYRGPARSAQRCTTSCSITLIGFSCFWGPSSSAVGTFLLFWDAFLVFGVLLLLWGRIYRFSRILRENT